MNIHKFMTINPHSREINPFSPTPGLSSRIPDLFKPWEYSFQALTWIFLTTGLSWTCLNFGISHSSLPPANSQDWIILKNPRPVEALGMPGPSSHLDIPPPLDDPQESQTYLNFGNVHSHPHLDFLHHRIVSHLLKFWDCPFPFSSGYSPPVDDPQESWTCSNLGNGHSCLSPGYSPTPAYTTPV